MSDIPHFADNLARWKDLATFAASYGVTLTMDHYAVTLRKDEGPTIYRWDNILTLADPFEHMKRSIQGLALRR